jgi:hypothetical protein
MFNIGDIVMHRFHHSYGYVICTTYKGNKIQWFNGNMNWHLPYVLNKVD